LVRRITSGDQPVILDPVDLAVKFTMTLGRRLAVGRLLAVRIAIVVAFLRFGT